MEGIREIAQSYYERAGEKEKKSVNEYFKKLDVNGNGKVSPAEYKKSANLAKLPDEKVFKQLDKDGDGALNFDEVLPLYYMEEVISIRWCHDCLDLLAGPYFSCLLCLGKEDYSYDLCCACYRGGRYKHKHSSSNLLDHHSLIKVFRERTAAAEKNQGKGSANSTSEPENKYRNLKSLLEKRFDISDTSRAFISRYSSDIEKVFAMEGIREIAGSYYERANEEGKKSVKEYFKKLDVNGDGKVSLEEYKKYKESVNSARLSDEKVFENLDANGDGALDFDEVLPLYYMEKVISLLWCHGCGDLLVGPYFSCLLCRGKGRNTYDLCCACYRGGKYDHEHSSSNLLDHHSLIKVFREHATAAEKNKGKGSANSTSEPKNRYRNLKSLLEKRFGNTSRDFVSRYSSDIERMCAMEGIREIAGSYYERASGKEKESVKEYFQKLDVNGDGKVSLNEYKKSVSSGGLSDEKVFKKLDTNGDRALDFDEVLPLYYMEKVIGLLWCHDCEDLLVGPYFSCFLCLEKGRNTYELCCACYRGGKHEHEHSLSNLLDHHSLIEEFWKRAAAAEKKQRKKEKKEMEELREIAIAHYQAASPEVKALADNFFKSLDNDGNERVDLPEFLEFLCQEGYAQMGNRNFFKVLDRDGNGTLDFWEVMTLYYIIKSGRPFCDYCRCFIPGIFFSCVECFNNSKSTFSLCRVCYQLGGCKHNHNGRTQFLDNYTLLEAQKDWALARATGVKQNKSTTTMSTRPNTSRAVVPAPKKDGLKIAFKAFETALAIGSIASTACTIL